MTLRHRHEVKLDLACGQTPKDGYHGVDLHDKHGGIDLFDTPWMWAATSMVDAIWCSHFVEHVPDLVGFMNEVHRICKPGAEVVIIHPYQHSDRAWQDPTHVRALNTSSWLYYDADWRKAQHLDHYPITADFEIVDTVMALAPEWADKDPQSAEVWYAVRYGVNVVDDLRVTLRARKD